jgi:membrane-associated phospholipid phosphatase
MMGWPTLAHAQQFPIQVAIVPGERLSDWLLRNAGPNADTTALQWQVQAERVPQSQLRQAVLVALENNNSIQLSPQARNRLTDWLRALPLTGRLTVAIADARWLQASARQDPVLQEGQRVVLPARPSTVTVVTESGQPCSTAHRPGALVHDYLLACLGASSAAQADWAWVAQPDGRTTRYGIAPWNQQAQAEPGPGAWIWAPGREAAIPLSVSDNLGRFLATQLPGEFSSSAVSVPAAASPPIEGVRPRSEQLTASDWGEIGLLQTPTARMAPSGDVRLHLSHVSPYTRGTVMFQRLDWLEAGFRYTDVANRLYGPDIAGNQSYKDKSLDLKLRLWEESAFAPQIALGLRDFGGTGLYSGEYLVANKRWGNWDASLGLGWGYLGARGNIRNPLSFLGEDYKTRPIPDVGQGGVTNTNAMFHGPTALFGGVQWHAPSDPWIFKIELDGNDYQHEPQGNNQVARSPFNFGAVYRYSPNIDFSFGLERGNSLMLGFTLHGGLSELNTPKFLDPVLPPVQSAAPAQLPPEGWESTGQAIERFTGWSVRSVSSQASTTTLVAETDSAVHLQERIDRAVTILHRDAPASSTRFVLQLQERGLPMSRVEIDRTEWVVQHTIPTPPALRLPAQQVSPGQKTAPMAIVTGEGKAQSQPQSWSGKAPGFHAEWGPSYNQILGGPDAFFLYQLGVQGKFEHRFTDSTWLAGDFDLRVIDNYDKFKFDGPSDLPRVRTYQREYVTSSRFTMPLLQLTHVEDLGGGHYVSAYAGMLESMYGGFGAEWLYRPWQSRLSFGIDVNHVRQRDFRQNLAFRDYGVNTGHATVYWDTGWKDLQVKLSAGRYLAGDVGATLDVRRVFSNGVAAGAWATKTDVSAQQFGEGSFDKGLYVTIPFDVLLPKSTGGAANIIWSPLTRDGGARLNRRFTLDDLTRQRDYRTLSLRSAEPVGVRSAEDTSYVLREPGANIFSNLGGTTATLGRQIGEIPASTWFWAGGAILASTLLDKSADNWAKNHQSGNADRLGTATNALPAVLALGTGLIYASGQGASSTAETALKAAGYTYVANLATRYVVGRARPIDEMGNASFNGFTSTAAQSGFPSNHVAVTFALITPFAQQTHNPWLYGLAAASAYGRVQKRDHWVSDTVAGAFMGYAIGSLLGEQQQRKEDGVRLSVTPQAVTATWAFK